MENIINEIYRIHDVECNQKYDKTLPYSFHLKMVGIQVDQYRHLIPVDSYITAKIIAAGHDLIEDARYTYNDIMHKILMGRNTSLQKEVAEGIFGCTESTGRTREERHDEAFFQRLTSNKLSVFVKLCDILANVLFSKLTHSNMYSKYRKEFPHFEERVKRDYHFNEYKKLFDDIRSELRI